MKVKIFGLIILVLGCLSSVKAQLYKDADNLADILKSEQYPALKFSSRQAISRVSLNKVSFSGTELARQFQASDRQIDLDSLGQYEFWGLSPSDSIILQLTGADKVLYSSNYLSIRNEPLAIHWRTHGRRDSLSVQGNGIVIRKSDSTATGTIEIFQDEMSVLMDDPFDVISLPDEYSISVSEDQGIYRIRGVPAIEIMIDTVAHKIEKSKGDEYIVIELGEGYVKYRVPGNRGTIKKEAEIKKICFLLKNSEFGDTTSFVGMPLENMYGMFSGNPFLAPFIKDVLAPEYSPYVFETRWWESCNFTEDTATIAWQNALYRSTSLLLGNRKVSLSDLEPAYETPVESTQKLSTISQQNDETIYREQKQKGVFDSEAIITGLSDFIVARAQEELNISFLDRLNRYLADSTELFILFPNTANLFRQFDVTNYKSMLLNGKQSFRIDLDNMGINFPKLLKLPRYKELYYSPDVYNLALVYEIASMVYREMTFDTILLNTHFELASRSDGLTDSLVVSMAAELQKSPAELQKLSNNLQDFCDTIDQAYGHLLTSYDLLKTEVTSLRKDLQVEGLVNGNIDNYISLLATKLQPPRRKMDLLVEDTVIFIADFYKNQITQNLRGEEYYGYILRDPELNKFDAYFSKKPKKEHLIAKGIDWTTELLDADVITDMSNFSNSLAKSIPEIRNSKLELLKFQQQQLGRRFSFAMRHHDLFIKGLTEEISYWETAGQADPFYTNALKYLVKVIEQDKDGTWLNIEGFMEQDAAGNWSLNQGLIQQAGSLRALIKSFPELLPLIDGAEIEFSETYEKTRETLQHLLASKNIGVSDSIRFHPGDSSLVFDPLFAKSHNADLFTLDSLIEIEDNLQRLRFAKLEKISADIDKAQKQIRVLGLQSRDLKNQLKELEENHSPIILKARNNASQLAKALEISIHLLYAFQAAQDMMGQAITHDTSSVQVTKRLALDTTRIQTTISYDSLKVQSRKTQYPRKWISKELFNQLMENKELRTAFLGLLYQRLSSIEDAPSMSSQAIATLATNFLNSFYNIEDQKAIIRNKRETDEKLTFQDYYPFIKTSLDLINTVITVEPYGDSLVSRNPLLAFVPKISGEALSLYENIYTKDYGMAIYNAMELFRIIWEAQDQLNKKESKYNVRIRNAILKYGEFMANVVDADQPNDISNALAAASLPPGSSRIKRESSFNLSLNSYFGAGFSLEKLTNTTSLIENDRKGTVGLTVPVGISASWGFANKSSLSVFASVIDIGTFTSFRIGDSNTEDLPEVSFKNVVAPGLFVFYNFADSPFTAGIGTQYSPRFRELTGVDQPPASAWRFPMVTFKIDVPIFNLYNGASTVGKKIN